MAQKTFCDVEGCGGELTPSAPGGAMTLSSPAGQKVYFFCSKHWKVLGENFENIIGKHDEEKRSEGNPFSDRGGSDVSPRVLSKEETPGNPTIPFPQG